MRGEYYYKSNSTTLSQLLSSDVLFLKVVSRLDCAVDAIARLRASKESGEAAVPWRVKWMLWFGGARLAAEMLIPIAQVRPTTHCLRSMLQTCKSGIKVVKYEEIDLSGFSHSTDTCFFL